ncbi:MAG: hypothetical protein WHV67_06520, partial [Thermoanaerobaculia bacterium]
MLFLLILSLFPKYPSEVTFKILENKGEIKIYSEEGRFRMDFKGKKVESYYVEKGKIMLLQDGKWKEIKKPLYGEDNFVISIFFEKEEGLEIEKETDQEGLKRAQIKSPIWGMVKLERVEIKKLKEMPQDLFPKKSKSPLNLSKFKSLLTGEDEKEVSATAGARGVG